MAWKIPRSSVHALREGLTDSIAVWSLQKALTARGVAVGADGDFGPKTKAAVVAWQRAKNLAADGVAGPVTQRSLVQSTIDARDAVLPALPRRLLYGFAEAEGGWLLAPVNWSVAGGVDCGAFQRRVYDEQYGDDAAIERAFNTSYQCDLLADRVAELQKIFLTRAGTKDGTGGLSANEKAWRLAALNHNYPSGADYLSRTPVKNLSAYWSSPQSWVTVHGFKFPNGEPVRTPLDWCHLYAGVLGNRNGGHKGNVTRHVSDWTP